MTEFLNEYLGFITAMVFILGMICAVFVFGLSAGRKTLSAEFSLREATRRMEEFNDRVTNVENQNEYIKAITDRGDLVCKPKGEYNEKHDAEFKEVKRWG